MMTISELSKLHDLLGAFVADECDLTLKDTGYQDNVKEALILKIKISQKVNEALAS